MYLNFHTHFPGKKSEVQSVQNLIVGKDDVQVLEGQDSVFSVGIHPWYLDKSEFEKQFHKLEALAEMQTVHLIGECGLDRLRGPELKFQEFAFEKQIKLAERVNKPLVIHCVKCFSELLAIKKKLNPRVPMVIHGYNNKVETGLQLLKAGFYFSIGGAIMREGSNARALLEQLPIEKVFLETDDQEIRIEEVYEAAAVVRKCTVNELKEFIFANWVSLRKDASQSSF
ncbi:TatD family hydrolase [Desertivirga arenae]|uniref:TatD family hydrolase n=1 Tax=Desertivirga arenae TaxID=2810309 RepID=UPI001A95DD13|nr:TatD family hydrolase [Pedobacter sp. SYSU D00823]